MRPEKLLHALESGGDTDADARDRDLARPTMGFGVETLSPPRRQHSGIAEPIQVGLERRAQFVGREPWERGPVVERLMQRFVIQPPRLEFGHHPQGSRASKARRSSISSSIRTCRPTIVSPPRMSFVADAIQSLRC